MSGSRSTAQLGPGVPEISLFLVLRPPVLYGRGLGGGAGECVGGGAAVWSGVFGPRADVGDASAPFRCAPGAAANTDTRFNAIASRDAYRPNHFFCSITNSFSAPIRLSVGYLNAIALPFKPLTSGVVSLGTPKAFNSINSSRECLFVFFFSFSLTS